MATDMTVANEILRQLGGKRFCVMTGAKSLVGGEKSLSMQLPKAKNKIKGVRIVLNSSDLYDVTFGFLNRKTFEWVVVSEVKGVYNDMLVETFERETGLFTKF